MMKECNTSEILKTLQEVQKVLMFDVCHANSKQRQDIIQKINVVSAYLTSSLHKTIRNCDRAECDSLDHAARVFVRETGIEMPENPTDSALMLWGFALCKWLYEEYKGGGSK